MIEFPTFPRTVYNPVQGAITLTDAEHAAKVVTVPTDWFDTAAEADAHRTLTEAQVVIHKGVRDLVTRLEDADEGVVHHSVTHQETVDRRIEDATVVVEETGAPVPKPDETTGAGLVV